MKTHSPILFHEADLVRLVALQEDLRIEQDLVVTQVPNQTFLSLAGFVLVEARTLLGALFLSLVVLDRKAASLKPA